MKRLFGGAALGGAGVRAGLRRAALAGTNSRQQDHRGAPTMTGVEAPDAAFATLSLDSVIRAADPPGADGVIQAGGFWDGTTYTPPANLIPVIDPTTDAGMVQEAAHAMMHTFEAAISFIQENRQAWPGANMAQAIEGIHWQIIAAARVGLNSHADGGAAGEVHGRVRFVAGRRERRRCAVRGRDGRTGY